MKKVFSVLFSASVVTSVLLGVTACGGSSSGSDEATADSYIQFYNGTATVNKATVMVGDVTVGTATYGDPTSLVGVKPDTYKLDIKDTNSDEVLINEDIALSKGEKSLVILTHTNNQPDYFTVKFSRDEQTKGKFTLYVANLSQQYTSVDVYISASGKTFSDAEVIEQTLAFNGVSDEMSKDTGKYNLYLTAAGQTAILFSAADVSFAYDNTYVVMVRDKHGPIADQLMLDVVLNSSSASSYNDIDADAQFRVYNSLAEQVHLSLDNQPVMTVAAANLGSYHQLEKGDYSLSVRNDDAQLLLNSALISTTAGESKAVLLYCNAEQQVEALTVLESDNPQLQAHDVVVANLVADFNKLQLYFVRQHETIATAKYSVRDLAFKKQQTINLPKDYFSIALVHVADNGSTTLLDKTDSMMLETGFHYMLFAEADAAAPSGYKLKLVR